MSESGDLLLDPALAEAYVVAGDIAMDAALARWLAAGWRVWIPVGSVGALGAAALAESARARLTELTTRCCWLAALADESAALADPSPRHRQIELALARLGAAARLLTRDRGYAARGVRACAPEEAIALAVTAPPLPFIDLASQQDRLRGAIERRLHAVLRHGHYIMGPEIVELESALARYVGVAHAITVASGTDSLEIALRALGVGHGDEVITVPFTWISSGEVIGLVGAQPVFVDIEPTSFNLDPALLEGAITARTKAILPVNLFGQMADYETINAIAARHGIPVIEDAAQSFGATRHGRRSCSASVISSTSFFPAKPLGCYGDGGALFTDDDTLAAKMRAIRTHGGERHHHPHLGMNRRLDTIQAAVLLAKLESWENEVLARNRIGARYTEALRGLVGVPAVLPGNTHVYAQYTIRSPQRDALAARLAAAGVPTAVYYPKCLHEQPVFAPCGYGPGDFPESERASREVLSLPMHADLDQSLQDRIIAAVSRAISTLSIAESA